MKSDKLSGQISEFKNYNGEGVQAKVMLDGGEKFEVTCGNDKLMSRFKINLDHNNLRFNINELELTGKTVICLAVD